MTEEVPTAKSIELPELLQGQVLAIKALAKVHNTLVEGSFPFKLHASVSESIQFIKMMHLKGVEEALKHPECELVPELKELKEHEAKNAKT